MKFDMGRAWNEAVALLSANKELLLVIAGIFIFLPNLALALFVPELMTGPANVDPEHMREALQAYYLKVGPGIGVLSIINAIGTLSMLALLHERRPTVGQALRTGVVTLLPYLLAQIVLLFGVAIVLGVPTGLAFALNIAVGILVALVAFVAFIYLMVKFSLLPTEMVIGGTLNPLVALTNSWKLTKGNSLRLFAFYLLLGIGVLVVGGVISMVTGLFLAMLGQNVAGLLLGGAFNGLFAAAWGALMACVLAAVYRQLAGPSSEAISETFE